MRNETQGRARWSPAYPSGLRLILHPTAYNAVMAYETVLGLRLLTLTPVRTQEHSLQNPKHQNPKPKTPKTEHKVGNKETKSSRTCEYPLGCCVVLSVPRSRRSRKSGLQVYQPRREPGAIVCSLSLERSLRADEKAESSRRVGEGQVGENGKSWRERERERGKSQRRSRDLVSPVEY